MLETCSALYKNNALIAMVPVALWRAAKKNNSAQGGPHCLSLRLLVEKIGATKRFFSLILLQNNNTTDEFDYGLSLS